VEYETFLGWLSLQLRWLIWNQGPLNWTLAWRRKCGYSHSSTFNEIHYVLIYCSTTDLVSSSDYTGRISNAWTHFRNEFLASKQEKKVHTNICPETLIFRGTTTTFTWPPYFRFLSVGPLKNFGVIRCNTKWSFHKHIFDRCQTILTSPSTFENVFCLHFQFGSDHQKGKLRKLIYASKYPLVC
jgi:hypothetical protein